MYRQFELEHGLATLKRIGWGILDFYDDDRNSGAFLHSTFAPVPSKARPVDCTHWIAPGPPDVWAHKTALALLH